MDELTRLVDASLERHGLRPTVDHHRLNWSRWFRCESGFSLWLIPNQPGLFAVGEEVLAPGENAAAGGKRMLAVFQICETRDLGLALGRLFSSSHPLHERIAEGRCFARYAVVTDDAERAACLSAFQRWLNSSSETASGFSGDAPVGWNLPEPTDCLSERRSQNSPGARSISPPKSFPSGF